MKYKEFYKARKQIEKLLQMDLLGPVKEDELIINENPSDYYCMGILFPRKVKVEELEQAINEENKINGDRVTSDYIDGNSLENIDEGISLANVYHPSSIAISTTVNSDSEKIKVKVDYAKYKEIEVDEESVKKLLENGEYEVNLNKKEKKEIIINKDLTEKEMIFEKAMKSINVIWKREPNSSEVVFDLNSEQNIQRIEQGLEVHLYKQKKFDDGSVTITIALINTHEGEENLKVNNKKSFFQVQMKITSNQERKAIFIPKRMNIDINEDEEVRTLDMLYSHIKNYALGHGCAVESITSEEGCYMLKSRFLPSYEIKQMKPSKRIDTNVLKMNFLANKNKHEVRNELIKFIDSYGEWINEQKQQLDNLNDRYLEVGNKNIQFCNETYQRIKNAIDLLNDDLIFKTFQLANKAMLYQRISYLKREGKNFYIDEIEWYPFQLAFILQEIPSIINSDDDYRDIVDLLWFPTGGGKTEAYLGISAFVIFLRRLRNKENPDGVTIIMRYTLRLLTVQQFERAAALICSCEHIRKEEDLEGGEINIGLFVGGGLTPNTVEKAEENLETIKRNGVDSVGEGNPCQVLRCPVCGSKIFPKDYKIHEGSMKITCPNEDCEYHRGLPIYLIDEDIYNKKPTLIISTIDKFARMTWEPRIGELFGIGNNNLPPDLIIQDELHLISGPLGTITGLYETAIDAFCHNRGIAPKIISSTATIRNAQHQILSLYGREFRQFPPQGLNIKDSYFAEEALRDDRPSRQYMGVLSPYKKATTLLIRVYACLQFATRYLKDLGFNDEVIDNFWTITGYFNSLRELGGAVIQVHDDVQDRFKFLYNTKFKKLIPSFTTKQKFDELVELTSRKGASEIAKSLEDLEHTYNSGSAFDYVLASNMISVGVDIGRLGLMIITGQPKSNSEYIQASSRVGRKNPGLVITVYNSARSRDRSHYEQFINYHSSIYKYVEATSVTPFSARARDRALHSIFISMCRYLIDEYKDKLSAGKFDKNDNRLKDIEDFIINRARTLLKDDDELQEVKNHLEKIKNEWHQAKEEWILSYDKYVDSTKANKYLLKSDINEDGIFLTLNSMRNVDLQSNVYLEEE